MTPRRLLAGLSALAVTASLTAGPAPAASAEPDKPAASQGRGPVGQATSTFRSAAKAAAAAEESLGLDAPLEMPDSYPSQPRLTIYPDNNPDATDLNQTISHDDLAPMLNEWMRASDRISTQVVGQSAGGRDLYLVTLTAPENEEQTAQQDAWKTSVRQDPEAAAEDDALIAGYKTPIWFSNNIHGNEWEGTDASMQVIEELVEAPWNEVKNLLREHRVYFSLSLNPDGRTLGQRATTMSLDANRDMITSTTPESRSFVRTAQATQPLFAADLHGYTSVLQVEPCGPPHGENYEYDLFIPHGYAISRQVEDDVVNAAIPGNTYYNVATGQVVPDNTGPDTAHIKIPYRDTPSGWDDYPPIFTAQYAAFFGAVTSTVELPKGRTGPTTTPADAIINTAVAKQTIESMIEYVDANSADMLANQIELFRRGVAGEPKLALTEDAVADVPGPDEWKALWDVVDDQDPVTLPRAYVIPVGDGQRSMSDAAKMVRHLLFNGIEVGTLDAETTAGGTTYPAGSYVVDMHQPLRGIANTLLDLGTDISGKVPSMYDISAWSYSYLWGATVDKVGLTVDEPLGATTPISEPVSNADIPARPDFVTFDVAGVDDFAALNTLLEDGATVSLLEEGSAVVGPEDHAIASAAAEEFGIDFDAATDEQLDALDDESTKGLTDLTVGYTGNAVSDDMLALTELGFDDLVNVSAGALNADPTLIDGIDVLWVGSNLNLGTPSAGRTAVEAWLAEGHGIVGRGSGGFSTASSFGLVSATAVAGNGSGNAIVDVETQPESVLAPHPQDSAFIYPATWFTGLGAGTKIVQSYSADPVLAGHWRAGTSQGNPLPNGPADAAGQAAVISGQAASGARSVVFGTSVFYRTHPKGGMSQAARALFWAGPTGGEVVAPSSTSLTLTADSPITYPGDATFEVTATSDDGVPTGTVALVDDAEQTVAEATLSAGVATLTVGGLTPGTSIFTAVYTPDDPTYDPSTSNSVDVVVEKASSTTKLAVKKLQKKGKVKATVTLTIPGLPGKGTVELRDRGTTVKTFKVTSANGKRSVTVTLGKGKHVLRAVLVGTTLVEPSRSRQVTITIS